MTIEAAPQPSGFTATFTIKVTGIRTATVNGLQNVIKQVTWTMIGEELGQRFELPQTTDLPNPTSETLVPLSELSEENVISWIEANETRIPSIKAHIQFILDKQIAESALQEAAMPWAPIVEPEPETPPIQL